MKRNDVNRSAFRGRRENSTITDFNYCVEDNPVIEPTPAVSTDPDTGNDGSNGSGGTGDTVTEDTDNGDYEGCNKIISYSIV